MSADFCHIEAVDAENLDAAAAVHAESWRASHAGICAPDFLAAHTARRQRDYLETKQKAGSRIFLLWAEEPAGIVSVAGSCIEDLYVLPAYQRRGYGTALLRHAVSVCRGTPVLWILETNRNAMRFYERRGFRPTGKRNAAHGPLAELEYSYEISGGETV